MFKKYRLLTISHFPGHQIYRLNFMNRNIYYILKDSIILNKKSIHLEHVEFLPIEAVLEHVKK